MQTLPHPALRGAVLGYFSVGGTASFTRRIIPDGCVDLLFNLTHARGRYADIPEPHAAVVGAITRPLEVERPANAPLLGVTFAPAAARSFLNLPIHMLNGRLIDLRDVWGRDCDDVLDALRTSASEEARKRILDAFLVARLARSRAPDRVVAMALEMIRASGGRLPIRELVDRVDVSERALERRFRDAAGLSPKEISRIARVQGVLARLSRTSRAPAWGAIAYEAGFADQAHLIREFRTLTGTTPGKYVCQHQLSDSFNRVLAEETTLVG
jgi:AraC-like DNA-binding protein